VTTTSPYQWSGDSWLLSGPAGSAVTTILAISLWTLAIVGFAALAAVLMGWPPWAWWVPLPIGASVASLAGLLLFPVAFPLFSTIGALAANVAVLVAVLWFQWAPSDLAAWGGARVREVAAAFRRR